MIKQHDFIRWVIILTIFGFALFLSPISQVFAQQEISLPQAIQDGMVIVQLHGIAEDKRFIEPMLQMELQLTEQAEAEMTIIIPQGLTFTSQVPEQFADIIMAREEQVLLKPNNPETRDLFAYSLDIDKDFPSPESRYEVGKVQEDSDLISILERIESAGGEEEFVAQLAVSMKVNNLSVDDVKEEFGDELDIRQMLFFKEGFDELDDNPMFPIYVVVPFVILGLLFLFIPYFPYRQIEELPETDMSRLWKARGWLFGPLVVIKEPKPTYKERFFREITTHKKLSHENIVPINKTVLNSNYIVMKYIEGCTLRELIDKKINKLSDKLAGEIALQILSAVKYLHKLKIVHRDINPTNILLNTEGHVYLIDFGLAWRVGQQSFTEVRNEKGVGTRPYAAPEVINFDIKRDRRSDIYSLGVVIVEMFTGRFESESPPFDTLIPELPEKMKQIADKCIDEKPEERWESVQKIEEAWPPLPSEDERKSNCKELAKLVKDVKTKNTLRNST